MQDTIEAKISELHDGGIISENYKLNMFIDTGKYFKYQKSEYQKDKKPEILMNVIDAGTIQDSSMPYDTYMKVVSVVFFAKEEYRQDVKTILYSLCLDLKSIVTQLTDKTSDNTERQLTVQVSNDEQPQFSDRIQVGYDAFNGSFDLNFIVFTNLKLSNNYGFWIDNANVPVTAITIKRGYEETPNLPKTNTVQFYQNTSVLDISVEGLFEENAGLKELYAATLDINTLPNSFNISFGPSDYDPTKTYTGTDLVFSQSCNLKGIEFSWQYGKLVSWSASFTIAANVTKR